MPDVGGSSGQPTIINRPVKQGAPMTRRGFLPFPGFEPYAAASGAVLAARGLEAHFAEAAQGTNRPLRPPGIDEIRISSNENPLGPGAAVLRAIAGKFPEGGRYPSNSTPSESTLAAAIASSHKVKPEQIVLGAGSQEILKNTVRAFTSSTRCLVTASPSFENCGDTARRLNHPVVEVKVDSAFRLDLDAMLAASRDAGLVFVCNPNNPTGTVHGRTAIADFVHAVRKASADTAILIDEAYHEYVADPAYASAIPLALETPNVVVSRTFSKAYGMAGLRVGYGIGHRETIKRVSALKMPFNVSVFAIAAALASLEDPRRLRVERTRNTDVRAFTVKALTAMGCQPADSHANFLFVDVHRPAKDFREACAKSGVIVGRDFPPFEKTHARISVGTMTEMQRATEVFRTVLRSGASTAADARAKA
jgi:histidinol-phosphate aminotransferase